MSSKTELTGDFWRPAVLPTDATIQDAANVLEQTGLQIVLVVNSGGELYGTVSDGDIRRGLLHSRGILDPITTITESKPLVVPVDMNRLAVVQIMKANKLHQIPTVDQENRLVGLHLWDHMEAAPQRPNVMVIMAGGLGTRMLPHTQECPKPMLELGGKPMLEHIIQRAMAEGFRRFVVTLNYLGHMIEDYFGSGERLGVEIKYTREVDPLGTAGALSLLEDVPSEPFVVTNGDVITNIGYSKILDFHCQHKAAATMAVRLHEWQNPFGVVKIDGLQITGFEEKPVTRSYINAGVYVLSPGCLSNLELGDRCDMPILFRRLQDIGSKTTAYAMHEQWLDVGRPDDYVVAEKSISKE